MRAPANHIRCPALILAAVLLPVAPAVAAPSWVAIEPPGGWSRSESGSAAIAVNEERRDHFGGSARVQVDSYQSPDGAAALHVVSLEGQPVDEPGRLARRQLDLLRAAPEDASLTPGQTALVSWDEGIEDDLAHGRIEWRHDGNETLSLARTLFWADAAGGPRQVIAECVMRGDAAATSRPPCERALASLGPAAAAGDRGPLTTLAQEPGPSRRGPVKSGPSLQPAHESVTRDKAVLVSSDRGERRSGSQWLYILGAAALVLAFYLTTRGRQTARPDDDDDGVRAPDGGDLAGDDDRDDGPGDEPGEDEDPKP